MRLEIREQWRILCEQIAVEEDLEKFGALFAELCLMLEQREADLKAKGETSPQAVGAMS